MIVIGKEKVERIKKQLVEEERFVVELQERALKEKMKPREIQRCIWERSLL